MQAAPQERVIPGHASSPQAPLSSSSELLDVDVTVLAFAQWVGT